MIIVTSEEFDFVGSVVDQYCLNCPEDTANDPGICDRCHVRHMMDHLVIKTVDHDEITAKAWALYRSPEKEEIADYSKYDALYEVTQDLNLSDNEYQTLLDEMESE